jgi:hypothetical protein
VFGVDKGSNVSGLPKVLLAKLAAPTIAIVRPRGPSVFDIDDTDTAADEVQMGLFDNFVEFAPGKPARLLADVSEADNWVGGDSRRFYLRVIDPGAKGRKFLEGDVEWWTSFANNDRRDHGANEVEDDPSSKLSLFEVPTKPGVFVSRGLMIVGDKEDRAFPTNSGISTGHPLFGSHGGLRTDQQSNFRTRRGGMHSFAVAAYTPKGSSTPIKSQVVPVFKPTSQRLIPLQVYILRTSIGAAPSIDPDLVFANDLLETTETFGRIGLWCWTFVSATDAAKSGVSVVKASSGIPYTVAVVDPPPGVNVSAVGDSEEFAIAKQFPGEPNTLRLFFVPSLASGNLGRSFNPSGSPVAAPEKVGACFVSVSQRTVYTAAHEMGHVLTDKVTSANGGHYQEQLSTLPRLPAVLNLMAVVAPKKDRGIDAGKRLWMVLDPGLTGVGGVPQFQISAIQASPFTR